MAKSPTDRSIQRIADSVRYTEQEQRNLPRQGRTGSIVPFEMCRFEMQAALDLPQNGPGTSLATKMRWDPAFSHIGMNYGGLPSKAVLDPSRTDVSSTSPNISGGAWKGDYSILYPPDDHIERIIVFDGLRKHSKMRTEGDDVGAYGIAWKPHDAFIDAAYSYPDYPYSQFRCDHRFWEIITMQTPGPFYGTLDGDLGYSTHYCTVTVQEQTIFNNAGGTTGFHRTLGGYDPFGIGWSDANGGMKVTVHNPQSTLDEIGDTCFGGKQDNLVYCEWHMRLSCYVIRWIEPSDCGYSSFVCDGNTIKVPPWVTGSPA